jgi:hypothetical protein
MENVEQKKKTKSGWDIELMYLPCEMRKTFNVNGKEYRFDLKLNIGSEYEEDWKIYINNKLYYTFMNDYSYNQYTELVNWIETDFESIIKEYEEDYEESRIKNIEFNFR